MKKFLTVCITLMLLVIFGAVSAAAVETSGSLWLYYKADSTGISNFYFDRLSLIFQNALSDNHGFKGEVRFLKVGRDADLTGGNICLDRAFYYQKNLLGTDELNIGYIYLPFYNEKCPEYNGDSPARIRICTKPSVGLRYGYKTDSFEATGAVVNFNNEAIDNGGLVGFDESLRIAVTPLPGFTLGLGYTHDVINPETDQASSNLLFDAVYTGDSFGGYLEYITQKPTNGAVKTGLYLVGSYQLADGWTACLGGTLGVKDGNLLSTGDYYFGSIKYQLAPKITLQGKYTINTLTSVNGFSLFLKVDF